MSTLTKPDLPTLAATIWDEIAPSLESDGRLQPGDERMFAQYCRALARAEDLNADLDKDGVVLLDGDRKAQKAPAWNAYREAVQQARMLGASFGIGAAARKSLGIKARRAGGTGSITSKLDEG